MVCTLKGRIVSAFSMQDISLWSLQLRQRLLFNQILKEKSKSFLKK